MGMWLIGGMALALAVGIWVGIGLPGVRGLREDRVVQQGRARRLSKHHIDLLKRRQ